MDDPVDTRHELGDFLRRKRTGADRSAYDLPPLGRSRTSGLRREEIAMLSGVSLTWYTWLEQGRDINPSRQVIDAIAQHLRLSDIEHDYVLSLAGFAPSARVVPLAPAPVPAHVQHVLDALDPAPAFAVNAHWDIAAWNTAYERLFPGVLTSPAAERNLLVFVFTDPYVRAMMPDWERTSRQFLAEFRAEAGARISGKDHVRLVAFLRQESAEFAEAWDDHEIERFASRSRSFSHPADGELVYEQVKITPQDAPDVTIVAYLPPA